MMLPPARPFPRRRASPVPSTVTVTPDERRPSAPKFTPPGPAVTGPANRNDRVINTDRTISCPTSCICRLRARSREKRHAAPTQVISHTFRGGECYLLCLLDSPRSCPTFLRQCLVRHELRLKYSNLLAKTGGQSNSRLQDFWNVETETAFRNKLFPELSPKEQQHQREIALCTSTEEWCDKTKNGQLAMPLTKPATQPVDIRQQSSTDNGKSPPLPALLPASTATRTKRLTAQIANKSVTAKKNIVLSTNPSTKKAPHNPGIAEEVQRSPGVSSPPLKKRISARQCRTGGLPLPSQEAPVCLAPVSSPMPAPLPVEAPPVLEDTVQEIADDDAGKLFLVERILGAKLVVNPKKKNGVKTRRLHYLIKWEGFDHRHSSWEPALQLLCTPAIKAFHKDFGRPTLKKLKILSPEGEKYETAHVGDEAPVVPSGRPTRGRPPRAAVTAKR